MAQKIIGATVGTPIKPQAVIEKADVTYVTEKELTDKGYLTSKDIEDKAEAEHKHSILDIEDYVAPDLSGYSKADHEHENYVTNEALESKGYLTAKDFADNPIGGTTVTVQADYSVNDHNNPAYIKERPFYEDNFVPRDEITKGGLNDSFDRDPDGSIIGFSDRVVSRDELFADGAEYKVEFYVGSSDQNEIITLKPEYIAQEDDSGLVVNIGTDIAYYTLYFVYDYTRFSTDTYNGEFQAENNGIYYYDELNYRQFTLTRVFREQSGGIVTLPNKFLNLKEHTDFQEVESIAKGANKAISFSNYQTMIAYFNDDKLPKEKYNIGQSIMIETLDVPDLWISKVSDDHIKYYSGAPAFREKIKETNRARIGYYDFSPLETQKVDLSEYVKNTDYASSTTAGVIKVADGKGTVLLGNGLSIVCASKAEISAKSNEYRPICPIYVDHAVKVGVTTNTIALTEAEKAKAQAWLGIEAPADYEELLRRIDNVSNTHSTDISSVREDVTENAKSISEFVNMTTEPVFLVYERTGNSVAYYYPGENKQTSDMYLTSGGDKAIHQRYWSRCVIETNYYKDSELVHTQTNRLSELDYYVYSEPDKGVDLAAIEVEIPLADIPNKESFYSPHLLIIYNVQFFNNYYGYNFPSNGVYLGTTVVDNISTEIPVTYQVQTSRIDVENAYEVEKLLRGDSVEGFTDLQSDVNTLKAKSINSVSYEGELRSKIDNLTNDVATILSSGQREGTVVTFARRATGYDVFFDKQYLQFVSSRVLSLDEINSSVINVTWHTTPYDSILDEKLLPAFNMPTETLEYNGEIYARKVTIPSAKMSFQALTQPYDTCVWFISNAEIFNRVKAPSTSFKNGVYLGESRKSYAAQYYKSTATSIQFLEDGKKYAKICDGLLLENNEFSELLARVEALENKLKQ